MRCSETSGRYQCFLGFLSPGGAARELDGRAASAVLTRWHKWATRRWYAEFIARAALLLALAPLGAHADSLGAVGPLYPIDEPDLLVQIQRALKAKEASGEIDRYYRDARARAQRSIEAPAPVASLATVTAHRTYRVDPSVTVAEAITDNTGRIIVPAGTRVNPLDTVTLTKRLFFFDARDSRQVEQAKAILDRDGAGVKLILVAGSYMDLMRAWKRRVYFDQDGQIVKRLGLTRVPALVAQDGNRLRVDEVLPGEVL
jgi:conjugal transfer pilus assembly protein TraW